MQKLKTLDLTTKETWFWCHYQWRWIVWQVIKERLFVRPIVYTSAGIWKVRWRKKYTTFGSFEFWGNCFFCHAAQGGGNCKYCPAKIIDASFTCNHTTYNYSKHPIRFYLKVRSMYREYLRRERRK